MNHPLERMWQPAFPGLLLNNHLVLKMPVVGGSKKFASDPPLNSQWKRRGNSHQTCAVPESQRTSSSSRSTQASLDKYSKCFLLFYFQINHSKTEAKRQEDLGKKYVYCIIFVRFATFAKKKKTCKLHGPNRIVFLCCYIWEIFCHLFFCNVNIIMAAVLAITRCIDFSK